MPAGSLPREAGGGTLAAFTKGSQVWVPDQAVAWRRATVARLAPAGDKATVVLEGSQDETELDLAALHPQNVDSAHVDVRRGYLCMMYILHHATAGIHLPAARTGGRQVRKHRSPVATSLQACGWPSQLLLRSTGRGTPVGLHA